MRPRSILEIGDRSEAKPDRPGADDQERDHDVEAVESSGLKKSRYRLSAALYQEPVKTCVPKRVDDGSRRNAARASSQMDMFDTGRRGGAEDDPARTVRIKASGILR